jgi:nucleoid DNA-binding protein
MVQFSGGWVTEQVVDVVIDSLQTTLLNNLGANGFTLKLGSFGKFSIRHRPGILRKVPFTGKTILTKDKRKVRFASLGCCANPSGWMAIIPWMDVEPRKHHCPPAQEILPHLLVVTHRDGQRDAFSRFRSLKNRTNEELCSPIIGQ